MLNKIVIKLANFGLKKFPEYFEPLEEILRLADMKVLFEVYVGRMILFSILTFFSVFLSLTTMLSLIFHVPLWMSLPGSLALGVAGAGLLLFFFHSYPYQILSKKKASIENNLPFALNHMSAIAAAGVPPSIIFKLLSTVKEYGEITNESKKIIRNMETFGMDMISAIKEVADRTPSRKFKEFLYSMISIIETGGDLKRFLKGVTRDALFEYRLRRERYLSTLSTYADFYTAILIAAPLFFIAILSVMSMIGGTIYGFSIIDLMKLGIYVFIPLLNIVFILFIHMTQPAV